MTLVNSIISTYINYQVSSTLQPADFRSSRPVQRSAQAVEKSSATVEQPGSMWQSLGCQRTQNPLVALIGATMIYHVKDGYHGVTMFFILFRGNTATPPGPQGHPLYAVPRRRPAAFSGSRPWRWRRGAGQPLGDRSEADSEVWEAWEYPKRSFKRIWYTVYIYIYVYCVYIYIYVIILYLYLL